MTLVFMHAQSGTDRATLPPSKRAQVPIGDPEDDEGGIGYDDEDDEDEDEDGGDVDEDEDEEH